MRRNRGRCGDSCDRRGERRMEEMGQLIRRGRNRGGFVLGCGGINAAEIMLIATIVD
jgi:hypothetical protein